MGSFWSSYEKWLIFKWKKSVFELIPDFRFLCMMKHSPLITMTKSKKSKLQFGFASMTHIDAGTSVFFPLCAHRNLAVSLCALKCTSIQMTLMRYRISGRENSPARSKVKNRKQHYIEQLCFQNFSFWSVCKRFSNKQCGEDWIHWRVLPSWSSYIQISVLMTESVVFRKQWQ